MPLVPFLSVKASPGVSVASTAIAAAGLRSGPTLLVECDPMGGDVAARFGLGLEPGLVSLAVELERAEDVSGAAVRDLLLRHSQALPGGLRVIVAPSSPEEMRAPLERLAEDLSRADCDVIADCGRLESASARERTPIMRLVQRAGLCVLVGRPVLAELQHLHVWLPLLQGLRVRVLLLLTQRGRYSADEISVTLGVPVIGSLPHDSLGAAVLTGAQAGVPARRLALLRSARPVAAALARELPLLVAAPADDAAMGDVQVVPIAGAGA